VLFQTAIEPVLIAFIITCAVSLCFLILCPDLNVSLPLSSYGVIGYYVVAAFSILLLTLPPHESSPLYYEWSSIGVFSYIRLGASVFVGAFLIGHLLLELCGFESLRGFRRIVTSYIMSIFLISSITYAFILYGETQESWAGILTLASALLAVSCVKRFRKGLSRESAGISPSIFAPSLLVMITVSALLLCADFIVAANSFPLIPGDEWFHFGLSLQLAKGFPVSATGVLVPSYDLWSSAFVIGYSQLTGLPAANSFVSLIVLLVMPLFGLYAFLRERLGRASRVVPIAVLLQLFGGFGWLALAWSSSPNLYSSIYRVGLNTYDLWIQNGNFGLLVSPTYLVGLVGLFTLLICVFEKNRGVANLLLFSFILAEVYLGHLAEAIFVIGFAFVLSLAQNWDVHRRLFTASAFSLGLLVVAIVDFIGPGPQYTNSSVFYLALVLAVGIGLAQLPLNFRTTAARISRQVVAALRSRQLKILAALAIIAAVLYSIGLDIEFYGKITFAVTNPAVPLYFYLLRLGVVGSFALAGLLLVLVGRANATRVTKMLDLLVFALLGFIVQHFALSTSSGMWPEYRFTLIWIPLSVFSAFVIVHILDTLRHRGQPGRHLLRSVAVGVVVSSILVSGFASTAFAVVYYSNESTQQPSFSNADLSALTFVKNNISANATVIAASEESQQQLYSFGGVNMLHVWELWDEPLLSAKNPFAVFSILHDSKAAYLYLRSQDLGLAQAGSFFYGFLLNQLPIVYKNSNVTIYRIPELYPPVNSSSDLWIPNPDSPNGSSNLDSLYQEYSTLTAFAASGCAYSVLPDPSQAPVGHFKLLLTDTLFDSISLRNYLTSGGSAIVLGQEPGTAASMISLGIKSLANADAIAFNDTYLDIGDTQVPVLSVNDSSTTITGDYTLNGTAVGGLMFSERVGSGVLSYLNLPRMLPGAIDQEGALVRAVLLGLGLAPVPQDNPTPIYYDSTNGSVSLPESFELSTGSLLTQLGMRLNVTNLSAGSVNLGSVGLTGLSSQGVVKISVVSEYPTQVSAAKGDEEVLPVGPLVNLTNVTNWSVHTHGLRANVTMNPLAGGFVLNTVASTHNDSWVELKTISLPVNLTRYQLHINVTGNGVMAIALANSSMHEVLNPSSEYINGSYDATLDLKGSLLQPGNGIYLSLFYWAENRDSGSLDVHEIGLSSSFVPVSLPVGLYGYFGMYLQPGSLVTIAIPNDSTLKVQTSTLSTPISLSGDSLSFVLAPDMAQGNSLNQICLYIKQPEIKASGSLVFYDSYIHSVPFQWLTYGTDLRLSGVQEFSMPFGDGNFSVLVFPSYLGQTASSSFLPSLMNPTSGLLFSVAVLLILCMRTYNFRRFHI
jgi:hypothetical protein